MNTNTLISFFSRRKWIIFSLCIITPVGFLFHTYTGPGRTWFNQYGAGVLYEVFWCLVVFFFIPSKKREAHIAISVFVITSILEVLQLYQPPFLQQLRATFLGAALLGSTFVWLDFPYYALGCFIAYLGMRKIAKRLDKKKPNTARTTFML